MNVHGDNHPPGILAGNSVLQGAQMIYNEIANLSKA